MFWKCLEEIPKFMPYILRQCDVTELLYVLFVFLFCSVTCSSLSSIFSLKLMALTDTFLLIYLLSQYLISLLLWLPPYLPSFLPSFFPSYLLSFFSSFLPSFLPSLLHTYLPIFFLKFLTFLPSSLLLSPLLILTPFPLSLSLFSFFTYVSMYPFSSKSQCSSLLSYA